MIEANNTTFRHRILVCAEAICNANLDTKTLHQFCGTVFDEHFEWHCAECRNGMIDEFLTIQADYCRTVVQQEFPIRPDQYVFDMASNIVFVFMAHPNSISMKGIN